MIEFENTAMTTLVKPYKDIHFKEKDDGTDFKSIIDRQKIANKHKDLYTNIQDLLNLQAHLEPLQKEELRVLKQEMQDTVQKYEMKKRSTKRMWFPSKFKMAKDV